MFRSVDEEIESFKALSHECWEVHGQLSRAMSAALAAVGGTEAEVALNFHRVGELVSQVHTLELGIEQEVQRLEMEPDMAEVIWDENLDPESWETPIVYESEEPQASPWWQAAVAGNVDAQFTLAWLLWGKKAHEPDLQESARFMKAAAGQNHPEALYMLSDFTDKGIGLEEDR